MDRAQMSAWVDALVLAPPDEADHKLAALHVRRLLGVTDRADDVLAALGLDGAEPPIRCGTCGYRRTSRNHQVLCS